MSLLFGIALFIIAWYSFDSPGEKELREQNAILKQQYELLNRRIDNSLKVTEALQNRDDNFYRVLMQMEPVGETQRNAGLNSEKRYRDLPRMSDGGLVKFLTQRVDLLERQLYIQSLSFDQIKEMAGEHAGRIGQIPAVFPISEGNKYVTGGYGMRRDPVSKRSEFHPGLDFGIPEGTPVYATANGKVMVATSGRQEGNMIEVEHPGGYSTYYSHLSQLKVKEGTIVKRGDIIGLSGSSGRSTGPHLHYEVRLNGKTQDPSDFVFMDLSPEAYADFVKYTKNAADVMD